MGVLHGGHSAGENIDTVLSLELTKAFHTQKNDVRKFNSHYPDI
jgi:hypothetical protein